MNFMIHINFGNLSAICKHTVLFRLVVTYSPRLLWFWAHKMLWQYGNQYIYDDFHPFETRINKLKLNQNENKLKYGKKIVSFGFWLSVNLTIAIVYDFMCSSITLFITWKFNAVWSMSKFALF